MSFLKQLSLMKEGKMSKERINNFFRNLEEEAEYDNKVFKAIEKMGTKKTVERKTGNIMKGRSDLVKKSNGKYSVDTEINVKKGLDDKVKRTLKKSVIEELDKRIKGGAIQLDLSSDDEDEEEMDGEGLYAGRPRGRGRPRKNDIKTYGNVLEHLVGHIKDPKEPIDKKDYKQAKEIIGAIEKKKRGRPRKVEGGKVDLGKALGIKPKKGSASYNARND